MPSPVAPQPQSSQIANAIVASPVSASLVGRWLNDLAYLHCKQVQTICSQQIPGQLASGSMRVVYNRSPGVQVIRVDMSMNAGSAIGARLTMGVSVSSGAITMIGDGYLNGTLEIDVGNPLIRMRPTVTGYFLVTGITSGTPVELIFTWANVANSFGPSYVSVTEVALADTNPQSDPSLTGEMGLDASWPVQPGMIIDGSATTKNGFVRAVAQLDRARADIHRHFQISTPEDNSTAWAVTSAASVSVPFGMNNNDFALRGRARLLYLATSNVYQARIRYKHSGANTGNVTFVVTPVGGASVNTTIALPNSAAWATVTGTVNLPVSGTGQEFDVQFKSDTTAGTQYLGMLALTEKEN
jgi:hypothetical protein